MLVSNFLFDYIISKEFYLSTFIVAVFSLLFCYFLFTFSSHVLLKNVKCTTIHLTPFVINKNSHLLLESLVGIIDIVDVTVLCRHVEFDSIFSHECRCAGLNEGTLRK